MSSILTSATHAAHAAVASLLAVAQIKPGADLPAATVKESDPHQGVQLNTLPGKVVIVGVPGAFTPPCSSQVPGYIEHAAAFAAKGVTGIYVVAVNDAFVTQAWKEKLTKGEPTTVHFMADDTAAFTSAVGLVLDATGLLGGLRAKRYVLIAEDGKVTHVAVEEVPTEITVTKAETVLALV